MNDEPKLIANKRVCSSCNDEIWSKHRNDYVTCSCGQLHIDGGREGYSWQRGEGINTSVWSDAPFEVIRRHVLRGVEVRMGTNP